jgi:hypothetical protein
VGLTSFAELQLADPGTDIELQWSPAALAGPEDCVQVGIYESTGPSWVFRTPAPGMPGALPVSTTSLTIPAGTLLGNEYYTLFITLHDVTTVDTEQVPGATGTAALATVTMVDFETGTATVPDSYAPQLLGVNPPIGATGVDPLSPVSFTFSEPMSPEVSILWSPMPDGGPVSYSWSENARSLTATPQGPFPSGQSVRWTLNPDGANSRMGDTSGNLFQTGAVSGSFKTTSVRFTTAPVEYLPGPVSVIQADENGSAAQLRFAAESLEGYLLQSSPDLENWGTLERVHSSASMAEMTVPIDSSGPSTFYRTVQFGIPPEFLTETQSEKSAMIYPEGGTLETTAADGIHYTLTIPSGALMSPVRITMTPLLDVVPSPFSGGLVAGVHLEPDGLSLLAPAELRMRMPTTIDTADLIGFQSESDGFHFNWHPWSIPNSTDIVMRLVHFSVEGAGRGTQEDRDSQPPACDPLERMNQEIAKILSLAEAAFRRGDELEGQELILSTHPVIEAVHENIISKAFTAAKSNRNLLPCAIYDYINILAASQLLGMDPSLDEPADTVPAILHAWNETRKKCTEGDYREIANLFWLVSIDQLMGFDALDQNAIMEAMAECLAFKMDLRSDIHYDRALAARPLSTLGCSAIRDSDQTGTP